MALVTGRVSRSSLAAGRRPHHGLLPAHRV